MAVSSSSSENLTRFLGYICDMLVLAEVVHQDNVDDEAYATGAVASA